MTFEKIKKELVDNQKRMTTKELNKFTINLALSFLGICLTLGMSTYTLLGLPFTIVIILLSIIAYSWVFDVVIDDTKTGARIIKITKLWWLTFVAFVVVFFVLKLFRFI